MIYLNVFVTVKDPADTPRVRELLVQQATLSRQEPGCVRFEVYQSQAEPTRFVLCERWDSQQALDAHRTAKAYTTVYAPHVLPLVDRQSQVSDLVC
jgi:quinol monooxygenase YgiN